MATKGLVPLIGTVGSVSLLLVEKHVISISGEVSGPCHIDQSTVEVFEIDSNESNQKYSVVLAAFGGIESYLGSYEKTCLADTIIVPFSLEAEVASGEGEYRAVFQTVQ